MNSTKEITFDCQLWHATFGLNILEHCTISLQEEIVGKISIMVMLTVKNYLAFLTEVCETYNWVCHAYCLMGNHYHQLIETPEGNLARGMRQLNGVYTQNYNRSHARVGHVFQGRYKTILVEKDSHLLELARYIVLNPVREVSGPGL